MLIILTLLNDIDDNYTDKGFTKVAQQYSEAVLRAVRAGFTVIHMMAPPPDTFGCSQRYYTSVNVALAVAAQQGGAIVIKTDAYYSRIAGFRADRVIKSKHRDTYHHFLSYNRSPAVAFMQYVWTTLSMTRLAFPGDVISMIVQLMPCTARVLV